jgi:hypothetical protein
MNDADHYHLYAPVARLDECLRRVGPNPKILLCDDQTSILLGTSGMRRLLAKSELLRDRTCCALDYICNFLGVRDVD